jgi:hypothetical protein
MNVVKIITTFWFESPKFRDRWEELRCREEENIKKGYYDGRPGLG